MKTKKIALLFFMLFAFKFSNAQRLDLLGGFNSSGFKHKISGKAQDNTGTFNFQFGMGIFVPFKFKDFEKSKEGNGIFPTLQFVKKGTSKSTITGTSQADVKLSYLQLNLPLSFVTELYGIGFGPYMAYALSGTKKYRVGNTSKQKIDFTNDIKRLDYGVSIDMKIHLFKIQYDLGLANIGTGTNGTVKTRNLSLSLNIPLVQ